jgi:hypothetical protein
MVGATRARSMTVLKHHIYGSRTQLFGVGEDVHVGQGGGWWLRQEHRAARLEQLDSDLRVIPGRRGDGHEVGLVIEELTAGSVYSGPVARGERSGTCWIDVDYADQLNVCVVLVAEGMRTSDRATSDDPDAQRFLSAGPFTWRSPSSSRSAGHGLPAASPRGCVSAGRLSRCG